MTITENMSLVQLANEASLLEQRLLESAELNAGEVDTAMDAVLDDLKKNLTTKVDAYSHVMKRLDASAEMFEAEAERFYVAAKRLKAAKARIKETILFVMTGKAFPDTELAGKLTRFVASPTAGKLIVESDAAIPAEFKTVETIQVVKVEIDLVKKAIKAGTPVPGAKLLEGWSLREYVVKQK